MIALPILRRSIVACAVVMALLMATPAQAQLDPLLFLKTNEPNVILAVDVSARMQMDGEGTYYDPGTYTKTGGLLESVLGLLGSDADKAYRRKYKNFEHLTQFLGLGDKYRASEIQAVGDLEAEYATFYERTRLAVARRSLIAALDQNAGSARFALIKTRQGNPTLPVAGNDFPLGVTSVLQQSVGDLLTGKWKVTRTTVSGSNSTQLTSGLLTGATATNANATIRATLTKNIGESGALLAAGADAAGVIDAPLGLLMDDAKVHASALINLDLSLQQCRNTIIVMVTGGAEGTILGQDIAAKASTLVALSGRRVPVYVIALAPAASDVASLQAVATNSGGQYFEITQAMMDAVAPGSPVPEFVDAVNGAVQHALVPLTLFNSGPAATIQDEHQVTSPIVGTVNLRGASKIGPGGVPEPLPDSETYLLNGSVEVPQRSNVMVTSGFVMPGFEGRLRARRVYKPTVDHTRPSGYKFSQDGSPLWVSSLPAAGSRNIYTVLPGSSTMVPFTATNVGAIGTYLGVNDPAALIEFVRQQPLGAIVSSTPAFMDPPSLDPPPDADYPAFKDANKQRRALIFVGANDGMLHALDARTGVEVWAFVPFNLLPKLRALRQGQSAGAFNYFVDSSPKIADVKVGSEWRTYLFFGQGAGGTFYNALDVTLPNMAATVGETSTNGAALLSYFAVADRITWAWSFPRNTSFDHTLAPHGELAAGASTVEKTIGETWSDPAIGQVQNENGPYVMVAGSGFLKYTTQAAHRSGVTRAGTTFYVIDVATGSVLGAAHDVGADSHAETVSDCRAANDCRRMKNALQMDPVATGHADQRFITKVYIGDLDGKVWRFALASSGAGNVTVSTPTQLYDAGADYPLFASMATVSVGNTNQYLFLGTGSDLLPSNGVNYSYSLLVLLDTGATATKTSEILLERTDWPAAAGGDEKPSAFPAVAGDIVFFTTTTHSPTTSCTPFSANLYAFTFIGGPAYDTNNDGKLSTGSSGSTGGGKGKGGGSGGGSAPADSTKVFSLSGARATAPFIVDQHLVFGAGGKIEMFGDPDDFNNGVGQAGVRLLSWRLVK